jgi:hypothetical protein
MMEENNNKINRKIWSDEEIQFLIKNFYNTSNEDLSIKLKRSVGSIQNKSNKLGLIKSREYIFKCIGKRNKMVGRDLTYDFLKNEVFKYKSLSELQKKDSSVYSTIRKKGLINELCSHMISKNFSIPQIILRIMIKYLITNNIKYNDRSAIKPYEIDVYLPDFNLGFEYNGKGWHSDNVNDTKKQKISTEKKIHLIVIEERSRNYIEDIKTQLKEKLQIINVICKTQITESQIDSVTVGDYYSEIYSKEDLKKISDKYTSFKDFYKNEKSAYIKISKLKLIDEYTSHMCCRRKKRNVEEVKNIINKYEYLIDLITNDSSTYQFIQKNKLYHLVSDLKRK